MSYLESVCICSNDREDHHCLLTLVPIAIDFCTYKFCINKLSHEIKNSQEWFLTLKWLIQNTDFRNLFFLISFKSVIAMCVSLCLLYLSASKRQWPLTVITKYTKCSIYVTSPQELVGSFDRLLFDYTTITSFHFSYSHFHYLSRGSDVIAVYLSRWISFPSVKSSSWEDESTHWFWPKTGF